MSAAPRANADKFDWVYFPMYPNDTAHAVHLSSLKFRPDGLLSAATRYPRTGSDPWTEQESKAGWYNYDERLVDCDTGFFVETATSLLARDGSRLATRTGERGQQVERLEMQLRESASKRWPDHSDVFLACAAASSPAFKRQRAAQAAKAQPLFSDTSIIENLAADNGPLLALARMRYDFSRIEKRPAALATDLFSEMRAQYLAWRKAINGAYVPAATLAARDDGLVLAEAARKLAQAGVREVTITSVKGAVVQFNRPLSVYRSPREEQGDWLETVRTDCEYGISVPVAIGQVHADGKVRPAAPLRAKAVLADVKEHYADDPRGQAEGPFGGFVLGQDSAAICQLLAQARNTDTDTDTDTALAYGIQPGAMALHATPAAMLLAIRAAHRRHAR